MFIRRIVKHFHLVEIMIILICLVCCSAILYKPNLFITGDGTEKQLSLLFYMILPIVFLTSLVIGSRLISLDLGLKKKHYIVRACKVLLATGLTVTCALYILLSTKPSETFNLISRYRFFTKFVLSFIVLWGVSILVMLIIGLTRKMNNKYS
jgi:hypothetical protein